LPHCEEKAKHNSESQSNEHPRKGQRDRVVKRHRVLDLAITWLPILGALVLGSAVTIWYGVGSKNVAIWTGFAGVIILALGFSLHLQKIVWNSDAKPVGPADSEINRQRAYVLVEASEVRYLAQERPAEAWISLKNNGLTPALSGQRLPAMPEFSRNK
jgi:hypothetical protein